MTSDITVDPPRRRFRHWKRWLVVGVLTVAVLAVAGPYVYIHFIEGPAPARFSVSKTKSSSKTGGQRGARRRHVEDRQRLPGRLPHR